MVSTDPMVLANLEITNNQLHLQMHGHEFECHFNEGNFLGAPVVALCPVN